MTVHLTEKGREKTGKKQIKYLEDDDLIFKETYIIVQSRKGVLYTLVPDDITCID